MLDGAFAKMQLSKSWNLGITKFELFVQKSKMVHCVPMISNGVIVKREAQLTKFSEIPHSNGFIS